MRLTEFELLFLSCFIDDILLVTKDSNIFSTEFIAAAAHTVKVRFHYLNF